MINEQAALNSVLTGAVLLSAMGVKQPDWLKVSVLLTLTVSLAYSLSKIPKTVP